MAASSFYLLHAFCTSNNLLIKSFTVLAEDKNSFLSFLFNLISIISSAPSLPIFTATPMHKSFRPYWPVRKVEAHNAQIAAEAGVSARIHFVDTDSGLIKNLTTGKSYNAQPIPPFMQELIDAGVLIEYVKAKK